MGINKEALVGYINVYYLSSMYVVVLLDKDVDHLVVFNRCYVAKEAAEKVAAEVNLELANGIQPTAEMLIMPPGTVIES